MRMLVKVVSAIFILNIVALAVFSGDNTKPQTESKPVCNSVCEDSVSAKLNIEGFNQVLKNGNRVYFIEYHRNFNLESMRRFELLVNRARANYIEGDILFINIESTGGSVLSCSNSSGVIDNAKAKGFEVFTSVDLIAASCGYKLLINSDHVYASKGATVGNIGVVGQYRVVNKDPRVFTVGSTRTKEVLAGNFSGTTEDKRIVADLVKDTFNDFKFDVIRHRGDHMELKNYDEIFSGKTFRGYHAVSLGLIDKLQDRRTTLELFHESGYEIIKLSLPNDK